MRLTAFLILLGLALPASAGAYDLERHAEEGRSIIQRLTGAMMAELKAAMGAEGPSGAVRVCRHLAPDTAAQLGAETGWEIRRTAFKVRNPDNRPRPEELAILRGYAAREAAGQSLALMESVRVIERDGTPTIHYMKAIPVKEPCLACHGSELDPEVAATLRETYPEDQAVGFAEGDLRGAFSFYKPLKPATAPAPEQREGRVVPGVQTAALPEGDIPLGLNGLEGDPEAGRVVFGERCEACHDEGELALQVFDPGGEAQDPEVCRFLETHGLTDRDQDCDILAYLKVLAERSD